MKLLYHTWFRTGSADTSNGIVDFLKEVKASPEEIKELNDWHEFAANSVIIFPDSIMVYLRVPT